MSLPVVVLPRLTVEVAGEPIEIRSLSRAEALKLAKFQGDPDAAEVFIIASATGLPGDEVAAWREASPSAAVDPLLTAILELSGLTEGAQKSNP